MSQSILITGCSSGIGYYCAHQLQKSGFNVIASARKADDVQRLKDEGLQAVQLDLADLNSIETGFEQALSIAGGALYGLFNNGAYGQPGALEDLPTEALMEQFQVNVFGWHHLTKMAVAKMRQQGEGRIIQNSSVLGIISLPYRGAYNASKYAIEGLSDTLRLELAGSDIHVSLVEPGPIKSAFRKNARNAFLKWLSVDEGYHTKEYQAQMNRLEKTENQPFTLGPEAVCDKVVHALTNPRPKPRYYVTFPTYLMGYLKRILSTRLLDKFLIKNR